MQALADVFAHFSTTRATLAGRARRVDTPDQNALLDTLPRFFSGILARHGRQHDFTVTGSIGNGNIARVPWVGIFNNSITKTAQNGYYIVLLFSEDMSGCFLSLNQGVTAIEKRYTRRIATSKMLEASSKAHKIIEVHPEALYGKIDLHSTGDLGRGYEAGAIESFYCGREYPISEQELGTQFKLLLSNYDRLLKTVGTDLQVLAPITEIEFQDAVLEKASGVDELPATATQTGAVPIPMQTHTGATMVHVRSPSVAAKALRDAQFMCELDAQHWTFESRAGKRPYVEAHHLIPMSKQDLFGVSIDVDANIVCLCATCHRFLHYGQKHDRDVSIRQLYEKRRASLGDRAIDIRSGDLLRFYSRELITEE